MADFLLLDSDLLLARFARQVVDSRHDLLDGCMRRLERLHHLRFGDFLRAGFDHYDAVLASGDNEVQAALLALLERRVDDELAIDETDTDTRNRLFQRDVGQRQRGGRARNRKHVSVVLLIG